MNKWSIALALFTWISSNAVAQETRNIAISSFTLPGVTARDTSLWVDNVLGQLNDLAIPQRNLEFIKTSVLSNQRSPSQDNYQLLFAVGGSPQAPTLTPLLTIGGRKSAFELKTISNINDPLETFLLAKDLWHAVTETLPAQAYSTMIIGCFRTDITYADTSDPNRFARDARRRLKRLLVNEWNENQQTLVIEDVPADETALCNNGTISRRLRDTAKFFITGVVAPLHAHNSQGVVVAATVAYNRELNEIEEFKREAFDPTYYGDYADFIAKEFRTKGIPW